MYRYILTVILFGISSIALAQQQTPPAIEWQKSFGGTQSDFARSIRQTTDGGYIVAGYCHSTDGDVAGHHGLSDYWVVKLNDTGAIQWQKSLGGTDYDRCYSIEETRDGGYILAGESRSSNDDVTGNHGMYDYWIVKLNNTGAIEWERALGGTDYDAAYSIQQTTDGGYIVTGQSASNDGDVTGNHGGGDYWVVKLNDIGAIQWERALGGTGSDKGKCIQQTRDGGYIVAGESRSSNGDVTTSHGKSDYWIVKLNDTGAIDWQRSFGGSDEDYAYDIQQTIDGGYIVAGESTSINGDVTGNHGSRDYWIVKLSGTGSMDWQRTLGGSSADYSTSIQQTSDSGYIVAGVSYSTDGLVSNHHGNYDYWVVKLYGFGILDWEKSFGGSVDDNACSIWQTKDRGYVIAGYSWSKDGDVSGNHSSYVTTDYWIVKLAPEKTNSVPLSKQVEDVSIITPNPASDHISITIDANVSLFSLTGQRVFSLPAHSGERIELPELASGVYIAKITSGDGIRTEKLIIR